MHDLIAKVEAKHRKPKVVDVRSGDTVRVHQKIKEGNKERVQVFEGFVIRTSRKKSGTSAITVRRIASGVGVEKTFLLHSPLITQVEVTRRSKVRRKYLSYMRRRHGKAARLAGVDFDKEAVNLTIEEQQNVEVGLDKDVDITVVETEAKAPAQPAEEAVKSKSSTETNKTEKPTNATAKTEEQLAQEPTAENADATASEAKEEQPEQLSKEDKAKLKKEKAKAFQKEQEQK